MKKPLSQLKNLKNARRKLVEPIVAPARKRRQVRAEQKKELNVLFGEQDAIDVLSYSGLEEDADYLRIDGEYVRMLFVSDYPFTAHSGWLDGVVNFNYDNDTTMHIYEVSAVSALPQLNRKITELESTKRAKINEGKIVGSDITDPLESAIELRDKIQRGQEKLFQLAIYVCIRATNLEELDRITRVLEAAFSARLFGAKAAGYQQLEALQSILPRGQDQLNQKRNLDSSSAALTFPFMSSELVQESGILYGVNKSNNSLVILDRFSLHNANSITFAQSGAGKSYTTKVEILRQLMLGTRVIVIDPEREYQNLAKSVDGTYIKLSTSSRNKINPFDLASASHSKDDLSEHIQDLADVIRLMVKGLDKSEEAAVDRAIIKVYRKATKTQPPLLQNLYGELRALGQMQLCERLEKYITGSLAGVFNAHTNIELDNRLVVFDIKEMAKEIRPIMMMIISNFVKNQVMSNPQKRLLVIDEAWLLLQHDESARFVTGLVRRARKYYLGVSIISQDVDDFLKSEHGRVIASQSALRILLRQDTTTVKRVVTEFGLSEYEHDFLLKCNRGDVLLIADQNHVAVNVMASEKEHPLITTNPAELYTA